MVSVLWVYGVVCSVLWMYGEQLAGHCFGTGSWSVCCGCVGLFVVWQWPQCVCRIVEYMVLCGMVVRVVGLPRGLVTPICHSRIAAAAALWRAAGCV
jgi:hypothetical protein